MLCGLGAAILACTGVEAKDWETDFPKAAERVGSASLSPRHAV